jgi:hypothetical protein
MRSNFSTRRGSRSSCRFEELTSVLDFATRLRDCFDSRGENSSGRSLDLWQVEVNVHNLGFVGVEGFSIRDLNYLRVLQRIVQTRVLCIFYKCRRPTRLLDWIKDRLTPEWNLPASVSQGGGKMSPRIISRAGFVVALLTF